MRYTPFVWPLLLSGAVSLVLASVTWRVRRAPGATPFALAMVLCAVWAWSYALDILGTGLEIKVWSANLRFPALAFLNLAWLVAVAQHAGLGRFLTRRRLAFLLIIPLITTTVNWTSQAHHLFRYNYRLDASGPVVRLLYDTGPWWWVYAFYGYALFVATCIILVHLLRNAQPMQRRQTLLIVTAILFPAVTEVLYEVGITVWPGFNLSSTMLIFTGILIGWALIHYRLFNIVPTARSAVLDEMDDAMLVLDAHQRVLDMNRAAARLLERPLTRTMPLSAEAGQPADEVLKHWPALLDCLRAAASAPSGEVQRSDLCHGIGVQDRVFDVSISTIHDRRARIAGRVVLLRDITARRQAESEREALITQLREALASVKTLTGLVPICASCKKIRNDAGYWQQVEEYVSEHSHAEFSHGICPGCMRTLYPEFADEGGR